MRDPLLPPLPPSRQLHPVPWTAQLHSGLWLVANHGAQMLPGGFHHADTGGGITSGGTLPGHAQQHGLLCTLGGQLHALATGRRCREAGSITQASAAASSQVTRGNTDCSASLAGSTSSYPNQCGCTAGLGGSLTTGRRCRKVDPIPQASEAALQDTRGNTDCSASSVGSCAGESDCTADFE